MPLPDTIRVKLSSEEAGFISITSVVVRDIPTRELIELMLGITGKDTGRIHELLLRGTLVSGASRFRWAGWDAERGGIEAVLSTFPDPDPKRPFAPEHCARVVLRGPGCRIELPRELAARRRLLRKKSFWDVLIEIAAEKRLEYVDYSYKHRADCYRMAISPPAAGRLKASAGLLKYSTLENEVRTAVLETGDLFAERVPV